jgi:3-hydroxyacyl-CoA dehydrogenase
MLLEHERRDGVVLLVLANPPVNALGIGLRRALADAFTALSTDATAQAVVLCGSGSGFSAGGDRGEFGTPAAAARPTLSRDVLTAVENCGKPVIAALHGFAVGGGLELALACHARIAVADTRVGLPEVSLGLIPLSGTQRLPRLVGLRLAAELMFGAARLEARALAATALFDQIVGQREDLLPAAVQLAQDALVTRPVRVRDRPIPDRDPRTELKRLRGLYRPAECTEAQRALLAALAVAVESADFQSGLDRAQQLFDALNSGERDPTSTVRRSEPG